jgi:hypothetical protein
MHICILSAFLRRKHKGHAFLITREEKSLSSHIWNEILKSEEFATSTWNSIIFFNGDHYCKGNFPFYKNQKAWNDINCEWVGWAKEREKERDFCIRLSPSISFIMKTVLLSHNSVWSCKSYFFSLFHKTKILATDGFIYLFFPYSSTETRTMIR